MYIYKTPAWLKNCWAACEWDHSQYPEPKTVFLTFDDGPIPEVTPWVLDTLATYQAQATFFCVGDNIHKHPEVFEAVCAAGHRVGNHTYNHLNGWKTPLEVYRQNVTQCAEVLTLPNAVAQKPLFRPPYGRLTQAQFRALEGQYRIVMWDVLTHDYDRRLAPERCLQKALQYTTHGSIVVFHDSLKAAPNLRAVLPAYLAQLSAEGYRFAAL
ncbi:polysaccharide deacetylase family protein [Eisenibacter elegans]|jgi:peptidoglycan/xylan/chitin deacetylase (PgdA/CDA1 family)|uniref:polysaccharide deacetylase family protein n=1 Tax=Eisenibacter elegans TaxID=997 RepID=UPI00047E9F0D|nr:polysaccharide deacetylase family protein [Eisenibacter elegans]